MFPYKCILITGATSGIGRALTHRIIQNGAFVIAVGRRQDRLDELTSQYGADKVAVESFDVSDITKLPTWIPSMLAKYPIDAAILNAGSQQQLNLLTPESVSLDSITSELHCNYLSPVHTTMLLLPHLQSLAKTKPAAIIYISSGLALVPSFSCLTYSASKAAIHAFAWGVREQVEKECPNLKIIEIVPPAVKTELHTLQGLPAMGVDLEPYIDNVWAELQQGNDSIRCDIIFKAGLEADDQRKAAFDQFSALVRARSTT